MFQDLDELRVIPRAGVRRRPTAGVVEQPWEGVHLGKTWRDMPSYSEDEKKLRFVLYRRGIYNPTTDENGRTASQLCMGGRGQNFKSGVKPERALTTARLRAAGERERETEGLSQEALARRIESRGKISRSALLVAWSKPNVPFSDRIIAALEDYFGKEAPSNGEVS